MTNEVHPSQPVTNPVRAGIEEHTFTASHDGTAQTYLVKDFRATPGNPAPLLVVYLHGATFHQTQGMTAEIYGNAFGRLADALQARNAVFICPEYRGNSWMSAAAEEDLNDIFRLARQQYQPQKILLMGGSMGGTSSLIFASRHPEVMDGVFALCPATDVAEMFPRFPEHFLGSYGASPEQMPEEYRKRSSRYHVQNLAGLPLAIVHGAADAVIPIHHARLLVEQLRQLKSPLLYEELEDGDHNAPIHHIAFDTYFDFLLNET